MTTHTKHFQHFALRGKMTFFEEHDDNGGAADLLDESTEPAKADEGVEEITPEAVAFDPTKFATEFGTTFAKAFREQNPTPAAPVKELTPEEARKALNVWEPDDAWYAKYDNLETRKDAIKEQRDALIKQADTIAQVRMQQMQESLDKRYAPVLQRVAQQDAEAQNQRFAKTYPELGKKELQPFIGSVVQSLISEGKKFNDEESMFKALAERAESVIKATNPNFKLSTPSASRKSSSGIPVTSPGGGGGGGNAPKPAASGKGKALAILGDVN